MEKTPTKIGVGYHDKGRNFYDANTFGHMKVREDVGKKANSFSSLPKDMNVHTSDLKKRL
jgi:hypothetical protein